MTVSVKAGDFSLRVRLSDSQLKTDVKIKQRERRREGWRRILITHTEMQRG